MIRLIASDIDGTLLHNGAAEIDPVIFEEIHRLKQTGILFCPASGRQYHSLRRLFAPAADELTYLCENGAVLFGPGNPGQLLGKTVMERERALALAHQIMDIPACEVLISGVNTSYLCPAAFTRHQNQHNPDGRPASQCPSREDEQHPEERMALQ